VAERLETTPYLRENADPAGTFTANKSRKSVRLLSVAWFALLLVPTTACLGSESRNPGTALSVTVENAWNKASYKLSCDPPNGNASNPAALCRTIRSHARAMLYEKHPGQICAGGLNTIQLHVSGLWEGKPIDANVDACSGNRAGEELWMNHLPCAPQGCLEMPADDPANGEYNYEHAQAVGIQVPRIPSADELCPPSSPDDGFSAEELDTPAEVEAIERALKAAPSCTVDPRLATYSPGYSVEAVRGAASAFAKGAALCRMFAPSLPAGLANDPDAIDRFTRDHLQGGIGVEPTDSLDELVRGCKTTDWGRWALKP
jgi:Subtilisin inhibitor-like